MSEITAVWHPLRDHLSIYGRFDRIESPETSGIPDVNYTLFSCAGWIENKIFEREGRCPRHLTRAQLLWAETEIKAGGRWFLFGRCDAILTWLVYDLPGAWALYKGEPPFPILRAQRNFPTRQLLDLLAPPGERRSPEMRN